MAATMPHSEFEGDSPPDSVYCSPHNRYEPDPDFHSPTTRSPSKRPPRLRAYSGSEPSVIREHSRVIYTCGRPPWYDETGQLKEAFVIGLCGGSASGKTTVATHIIKELDVPWVSLVSTDSFYKVLTPEEHDCALASEYNFDHPDAFDFDLMVDVLKKLKNFREVDVPVYNFTTHSRETHTKTMYGANVVIFEGILAFTHKALRELMDLKIFVDTDSDIRLARRLLRDIRDRGRDVRGVLHQYETFVKPGFDTFIEPTKAFADLIIPRGGENQVAIELIVRHVNRALHMRGYSFRKSLAQKNWTGEADPVSLCVLPSSNIVRHLHTIIRNRETRREDFIFYSKRLMRLLFEYALSIIPYETVEVATPQGIPYKGARKKATKVCGISILRAGETMEQTLCEVLKDVRIGKLLIQTNHETEEVELHYHRLPSNIQDSYIFLMDATVATGAAAMMAIRVLLDHDIPEDHIMLVSLLMAKQGVHSIGYAFPKVKIVTTAVDPMLNDKCYILPGLGNFGDRFYGT